MLSNDTSCIDPKPEKDGMWHVIASGINDSTVWVLSDSPVVFHAQYCALVGAAACGAFTAAGNPNFFLNSVLSCGMGAVAGLFASAVVLNGLQKVHKNAHLRGRRLVSASERAGRNAGLAIGALAPAIAGMPASYAVSTLLIERAIEANAAQPAIVNEATQKFNGVACKHYSYDEKTNTLTIPAGCKPLQPRMK